MACAVITVAVTNTMGRAIEVTGGVMNERWVWVMRCVVVIVPALILAAALAQFLGYGGALLVFWLLARRAAGMISREGEQRKLIKSILVPLATLIAVACAHSVLLLILDPLMSKAWMPTYNWTFTAGIILSAVWLVAALFTGSSSLEPLFGGARAVRRQ